MTYWQILETTKIWKLSLMYLAPQPSCHVGFLNTVYTYSSGSVLIVLLLYLFKYLFLKHVCFDPSYAFEFEKCGNSVNNDRNIL